MARVAFIVEHFGEFLACAVLIGDVSTVCLYFYGLWNEAREPPRTGNVVYDFFMGTTLYPRIGIVDIKMVAEARWSWLTLAVITMSCCFKQYEETGTVSPSMATMMLAHWLYSNATVKGEHYIVGTWDMFQEIRLEHCFRMM